MVGMGIGKSREENIEGAGGQCFNTVHVQYHRTVPVLRYWTTDYGLLHNYIRMYGEHSISLQIRLKGYNYSTPLLTIVMTELIILFKGNLSSNDSIVNIDIISPLMIL